MESLLSLDGSMDIAAIIGLSKKKISRVVAILSHNKKLDVTELVKTAQQTYRILSKCVTDYGDLTQINTSNVEFIYGEICKYEKKIEQLSTMGSLARFISQSRLRSKLDQLSNSIAVQVEVLERHIKEIKFSQLLNDNKDEYSDLLIEIDNMPSPLVKRIDVKKLSVRRSVDQEKKIKDEETKIKLDNQLSVVKDPLKRASLLSVIPKLHVTPLVNKEVGRALSVDEEEQVIGDNLSAWSVSTYPYHTLHLKREGDPICDQYCAQVYENRIIAAVADGCSWGIEPKEAARKASRMFVAYMRKYQDLIETTETAAEMILRAYNAAHQAIIQDRNEETLYLAGTTTMIAGILLQLETEFAGKPYVFVCASIGDCKAYCYNRKTDQIKEITTGNRGGIDARDPGGRIGPTLDKGAPDLRNLILYCYFCDNDETIVMVTDGVHDNLDPRQLGKTPKEIGMEVSPDNWETCSAIKPDEMKTVVSNWTESFIRRLLPSKEAITPSIITKTLVKNSINVTAPMRDFMENNPGKRLPVDYKLYPGKVDHTTCMTFRTTFKKQTPSGALQITRSTDLLARIGLVDFESRSPESSIDILDISPSSNSLEELRIDDTDQYAAVWDTIFGEEVYVISWNEFIAKLPITVKGPAEQQLKMILDYSNTNVVNRFKFTEFLKGFGPLDNCVENVDRVLSADWFFGYLSTTESKRFLEQSAHGTFLIRFSSSKPGSFALDFVQPNGSVRFVRLTGHPSGGFASYIESTGQEIVFKSLNEVIDIYTRKGVLTKPFSSTLRHEPWFFGDLTAEEASELLASREPGTFLIRFSQQPGCFAASFVDQTGKVLKGLITKNSNGYQVNNQGTVFSSVTEIVEWYKEAKLFVTPLSLN